MSDAEWNYLGDLASVVGVLVTIGGFALALWQIQKTKSASEQARSAAESVRAQILQMNAIQGINAAIKAFEDIRRLHRLKAWETLPDRYTSLKQELILIQGRTPNLGESPKTQIQGAISQLTTIEGLVESTIGGAPAPEVDRMNRIVSRQIERLAHVLVEIQNEIDRLRQ